MWLIAVSKGVRPDLLLLTTRTSSYRGLVGVEDVAHQATERTRRAVSAAILPGDIPIAILRHMPVHATASAPRPPLGIPLANSA